MANKYNLEGKKFGRLTVICRDLPNKKNPRYECRCDCGCTSFVRPNRLISGETKSCGCLARETARTHGMSQTRTHKIWTHMKQRCTNPERNCYARYGARGITVCDRWLNSFENFLEDMGEAPEGLTIERVDNDKGYEKNNCKWIPLAEQALNTSQVTRLIYEGERTTLPELARKFQLHPESLRASLKRYETVEEAVAHSVEHKRPKTIQ